MPAITRAAERDILFFGNSSCRSDSREIAMRFARRYRRAVRRGLQAAFGLALVAH